MRTFCKLSAVAIALSFSSATLAAQSITTGAPTGGFGPLGKDASGTYATALAQTFAVASPSGGYLQSFTLFYQSFFQGGGLKLTASVYEFDNTNLKLGANVFMSALFSGTNSSVDEPITFSGTSGSPFNFFLAPGVTYALVLSSLDGYAQSLEGSAVQLGTTDVDYTGGSLFYSMETSLTSPNAFTSLDGQTDAAFTATITDTRVTATPEPTSLMLVGTGLAGLGGFVRRRRRQMT